MIQVAFDTLAYAKKLKAAGLDSKIAEVQAEVQVEMLNSCVTENLASKQDVNEVKSELEKFRVEFRSDLEGVRTEFRSEFERLRAEFKLDMKNLEHRLTLRLGAIVVGAFTLLAAWTTFLPHFH
ncbi:hypothetical protein [Candidiatus Paracoxiella cheracis]|uniref:hypothetical protein n=1 Tax=Candidiatus Paracoxiella cheracis TaxID=3405120 RepID=UPI003BF53BDF